MGSSPPDRRRERHRFLLCLALVTACAAGLRARSARYEFSYLDDDTLILADQTFLSQPESTWRAFSRAHFAGADRDHIYYRPVVTASYALDARRGGTDPHAYHLTNVVLHAIAAALLFMLLRRWFHRDGVALWGAVAFAAHPALTEAVAWIPGRNDLLVAVFALGAWLCLPRAAPPARAPRLNGFVHQVLWACALFTKETAVVLPVLWLAQLFFVEQRCSKTGPGATASGTGRASRTKMTLQLVGGWVAVLTAYGVARAAVAGEGLGAGVAAARLLANLPLLVTSLGKLILPVHLSVLAIPEDTPLWPGIVSLLLLLLSAILLVVHRRRGARVPERDRSGARPSTPPVHRGAETPSHDRPIFPVDLFLYGLGCFLVLLLPALPASNVLILESRLYLPAVGVVCSACAVAAGITWPRPARRAAGVVIVAALMFGSWSYEGSFRDRLAFSRAAVEGSPHSSLAHRNLGVTYHLMGDTEAARRCYEAALAEDTAEPIVHNNLAVIAMADGRLTDAESHLRRELALQPRYAPAHRNLALVLGGLGRVDEAAPHWQAIVDLGAADDIEALRALSSYYDARDRPKAVRYRALLDRATSLHASQHRASPPPPPPPPP